MTEQNNPQLQPTIDNNILRLLIREAVEREVANVVAPLRTAQQVQDGMLRQFNRDVATLQNQCGDLDELVRGNPKQNLIGLADQIRAQNSILEGLQRTVNQSLIDVQRQVSSSVAEARKELGAQIDGVKGKQDEATRGREALINQWRGAKYAIFGLSAIVSLPYLETIGKLLRILP